MGFGFKSRLLFVRYEMEMFLSLSFLICEMGIMMPGPETMCRLEGRVPRAWGHCSGTSMVLACEQELPLPK